MKYFLLLCTLFISLSGYSQTNHSGPFTYEGYLFSADSVPIEDAHLINYRTTKIVTTDSRGYFKTIVQAGDSLMINHISLAPLIIHVRRINVRINRIYVPNKTYRIKSVSNTDFQKQRQYAEQNLKQISRQLGFELLTDTVPKMVNINPYDDNKISQGINLKGFFKLFKKRKRRK